VPQSQVLGCDHVVLRKLKCGLESAPSSKKQVATYRDKVVSIAVDIAPDQVSSNVFAITLILFDVGNFAVKDVAWGVVT
jgi:hypothetical protein